MKWTMLLFCAVIIRTQAYSNPAAQESDSVQIHIRNLSSENVDVRLESIQALEQIGTDKAVRAISEGFRNDDIQVRLAAIQVFKNTIDTSIIEKLIFCLKDDVAEVRKQATAALGHQQNAGALFSLIEISESDPNPAVRKAAHSAVEIIQSSAQDKLITLHRPGMLSFYEYQNTYLYSTDIANVAHYNIGQDMDADIASFKNGSRFMLQSSFITTSVFAVSFVTGFFMQENKKALAICGSFSAASLAYYFTCAFPRYIKTTNAFTKKYNSLIKKKYYLPDKTGKQAIK